MAHQQTNSNQSFSPLVVVLLVVLLLSGWSVSANVGHDNQTSRASTSFKGQNQRQQEQPQPPRGYCVRISRAIPRSSRCFKHLVVVEEEEEEEQMMEPMVGGKVVLGAPSSANNQPETSSSRHDEKLAGINNTNNNGQHQRMARNSEHNSIREELVYVRLETIGSGLSDLSTQVINERILLGVLDQLLYGPEEGTGPNSLGSSSGSGSQLGPDIKEQGNNNNNQLKNLIPSHVQTGTTTTTTTTTTNTTMGAISTLNASKMPPLDDITDATSFSSSSSSSSTTTTTTISPPPSGQAPRASGTGNLNYYDEASPAAASVSVSVTAESDGPAKLEEKCRLSMEKFLCRLVYPSCHFRRADISALVRPPCREDCLLLRDSLCPNLNWPKFTRALNRAFNVTLMSAINVLDLAVEGDGQARRKFILGLQQRRPVNHNSEQSNKSMMAAAAATTTTTTAAQTLNSFKQTDNDNYRDDQLNSSIHFYWPHEHSIASCESLPPLRSPFQTSNLYHNSREAFYGHHTNKLDQLTRKRNNLRRPVCSNAHLTETIALSPEEELEQQQQSKLARPTASSGPPECLTTRDGANYGGKVNYTNTMIPCQSWASQWPHSHKGSELLFDNMRGAHNYCRNPGGLELKPWCYTMDPKVRWQYCNIKPC